MSIKHETGEVQNLPPPLYNLHPLNFKDQTLPTKLSRGHLPMCQISFQ